MAKCLQNYDRSHTDTHTLSTAICMNTFSFHQQEVENGWMHYNVLTKCLSILGKLNTWQHTCCEKMYFVLTSTTPGLTFRIKEKAVKIKGLYNKLWSSSCSCTIRCRCFYVVSDTKDSIFFWAPEMLPESKSSSAHKKHKRRFEVLLIFDS